MKKDYKEKQEIVQIRERALELALAQTEEINKKREKELEELDKTTRILLRRDLDLHEIQEKREKELLEMDRTTKMLLRRDFELAKTREKREKELEELKVLKQQAEEEKNKTLAIITNFAEGILVFNENDNLQLKNPKAEKFLDSGLKIDFIESLVRNKTRDKELEVREDLILEISCIALMREGVIRGTLVILHDITRAKLIEKTKSEFVSLAAHQLRTPLSAIKWIFTMFLEGELGKLNQEQKEFLQDGYDSNQRMIDLVNDLLNVARIEEGRYVQDKILVTLKDIFPPIINYFKKDSKKHNINFIFKKPSKKLPKVLVDVDKMKIVLENIIDNAVAYTSSGGTVTVSLKYSKKEKEIEISVKDTGMGIPENQRKNIFKKFFRAANVVRKQTDGTGLGLFISKNIIKAHNGKIWFKSEENKGTIFHFTIPVENSNIK